MITAVLIDDESKGRMSLRKKLTAYCPQVEVVGEASNGVDGISLIEAHDPQIVFLDIEMPKMDGFEMLHHLPRKNFHLIFTTAYDQYAIKAFKYSAFDYLLKPVDIAELQSAVQNVEEHEGQNHTKERLEVLQQNLSDQFHLHKISIPTMEGLLFFNIADIICLEADSNYSTVHFSDHLKLLTTRTLGEFEEMLPSHLFFRPHHSWLINLSYIKKYMKGDGGQIEMQNGVFVDVARSRKAEFIRIIK
ncbi:MAG TPA: LytTR family DNA-binding domain-containing protein [Saprospiraceae bacterium]|nr:LytTR family DNA-binding domain-containing protein [Saprospiraceae bacterium]